MKTYKKIFFTLTFVVLLIFNFVSCNNSNGENNKNSESLLFKSSSKNIEKNVKFDWYIHFQWYARRWGESVVSKYISGKTGVDLNFIVPNGNEGEKLQGMIMDKDLPDFITIGWWEGQVYQLIDEGLVYPLDELAEQYCPEFFDVVNNDKMGWYRHSDGHVYCYPNCSYTPSDYEKYKGKLTSNETFMVRKDIYEAIGSPDMSTPEGFLNALMLAQEKFPMIGDKPLIPFGTTEVGSTGCSTLQKTLSHFLAITPEKDGLFTDPDLGLIDNADYVRWLRTFRKAHELGLIKIDFFLDKRNQIEEKAGLGRYFCLFYPNIDMQTAQNKLYMNDSNSIYIAVKGPANSKGDDPKLAGGSISGWTVSMISKNCKNPEKAIKFLTYLISEEGQYDTAFGIRYNTYAMIHDVPTLTDEIKAMDLQDKNKQENEIGVLYTYWMLEDKAWMDQFGEEYAPYVEQPQLWTRPYVVSYAIYDGLTLENASAENEIYNELLSKWGKAFSDLISAENDKQFDKILKEYKDYRDAKGYRLVQEAQTKLMNANKAKLGM